MGEGDVFLSWSIVGKIANHKTKPTGFTSSVMFSNTVCGMSLVNVSGGAVGRSTSDVAFGSHIYIRFIHH